MGRKVFVIGIGPGGLGQLTLDAVDAMNQVDVFLVGDHSEDQPDLVWLRSELLRRHVNRPHRVITVLDPKREHPGAVDTGRLATYSHILSGLPSGDAVGFLAWGDPGLYDSILRVVDALRDRLALEVTVIPGVSALQVLAAAHQIALNAGASVHITTGARLLAEYRPELGDVVVMNDPELACRGLVGEFPDTEVFWGAYLGTPDQVLANGPLGTIAGDLAALRQRLQAHHGWIHDTYLLRPVPDAR
ncbi:MAG TPA: precorrin-6A synthase (deacetylating) [Arachnia sp.]|nr:precorrin-6A synthase (deacetylating) [Arachnia sp.]